MKIKKNYDENIVLNLLIKDAIETVISILNVHLPNNTLKEEKQVKIEIPENTLNPNNYIIDILVLNEKLEILTGYQNLTHIALESKTKTYSTYYINIPFNFEIK